MGNSLIILQLLLPIFFGSGFCLLKRSSSVYFLGILVSVVIATLALVIFINVLYYGNIIYYFGGWLPPFGIEFKITKLKAFFILIFSLVLCATTLQRSQLFAEIPDEKIPTFCGMLLLCFAGFLGVIATNDFFNMYVFIEIASITSYSLVSVSRNNSSAKFALDYLIVGTIAATFILIGIGYIYAASGTLNIDDFLTRPEDIRTSKLVHIAYYFMTIGLCIKTALSPFHNWFVNAYRATNSFILPFFAGISSKTYMIILLLLNLYVFNFEGSKILFIILGSLAALLGSVLALKKKNLREILIFSSIAETGYVFIALGIGGHAGAVVVIIFIISNILSKVSLFILNGNITDAICTDNREMLHNLNAKMPVTTLLFIANSFNSMGIPATIGFIAKISLLIALFSENLWVVILVVLVSSLMSLIYNWRVIESFLYPKNMNHSVKSVMSLKAEKKYLPTMVMVGMIVLINITIGIFFREFSTFIEFLMH